MIKVNIEVLRILQKHHTMQFALRLSVWFTLRLGLVVIFPSRTS